MSDSQKLQAALDKIRSGKVKVPDRTPQQIRHDYNLSRLSQQLQDMERKANQHERK